MADALATGGLIGPEGLAGTGLLANTGDPDNINPTESGILVDTGEALIDLADAQSGTASDIDGAIPGDQGIVSAVVATVDNVGNALVDQGNGEGYLADGLVGSVGPVASVAVAGGNIGSDNDGSSLISGAIATDDAQPVGDLASVGVATSGTADDSALIGVSVASEEQNQGELLTVGLASGGENLTLETPALEGGGLGDVLDTGTGDGAIEQVAETVDETVGGGLLGDVGGTVDELVGGGDGGLLGGAGSNGLGGATGLAGLGGSRR